MQKFPILLTIFITSTIVFAVGFLSNLMPLQPAQALAQADEPDIPTIVEELYFGIPAGNGHRPRLLAVDSRQERIYTFNEGLVELPEGNTISVIDRSTGQIIDLIKLNNKQETGFALPTPLDLQVDPYRPRLYAIWGDLYGDISDTTLTIIDTDSLTVVETLPGVEAIAPGPDRLYLANDSRLWAAEPDSLSDLESRDLELRQLNEGLLLSSETNRLYLRRGQPWSLEIFAADTLAPVSSYPTPNELLHLAIDGTGEQLFVIEKIDTQAQLQALDRDGQPRSASAPTPIADNVYSKLPLALSDDTLYLVDQDPDTFEYRLRSFTLPGLRPLDSLPLPTLPNDLLLEFDSGLLYAAFDHPSSYLLEINPATQATQAIFTALEIVDALANPKREHLYVLNDAATLQILDAADYDEITQVDTGHDLRDSQNRFLAELALDPGRNRLYLSGTPVRVIETDTFDVTAYPDLQGQLTPDPSGERVYLTPPCECRQEQCNTLVLKAETLTGTQTLFPPEDPFTAPCVYATRLDSENQLLYTLINNGVPGSNSGSYFAVFDTAPPGPPEQIYTNTNISYGSVAFDPSGQRAYLSRYRQDRSFIQGFEASLAQGSVETITQTLQLGGAQGDLVFDPQFDRLYAVNSDAIQVFDSDLTLLAETTLPGEFELLTFDPQNQRLYLSGANAQMLVVATSGGQLELPPPPPPVPDQTEQQRLFIAPDGTLFRIDGWQLFRSTDEGQSWQRLGRGLPDRLVNDLAISPSYAADQTLLVGLWDFGRGGGLYRSTDGGDTWRPTTRGLTDLEIEQIIFSPTFARDQTVFLTTLEDGLFRSTDGGDTWVSLAGENAERRVSHLAVSPTFAEDGLLIFGYRELLRSTDGGDSWSSLGLPAGRVAFSPDFANDGLVLSEGRWRSTDRGQTWQPAAAGREPAPFGIEKFIFSPDFASDQTIYILFQTRILQRSVDAGRTWQSLLSGLPPDFELAAAAMFPRGELLLSSLDGQQLTVAPETLEWGRPTVDIEQLDLQDLAITPDRTIFVANSTAGVFKSTDEGRTWTETGFPARAFENQLARLALADDGTLFAAAGPAIERTTDGGQPWTYLSDVPISFSVASLAVSPDFADDGLVLAGGDFQQNQILRSADGGDSWTVVFDGETVGGSSDVSLLAVSPNVASDGTAYAWLQEGGLLRSTDRGRSWTLVFDEEAEGVRYFGQSLAVSPDAERLYLGALDGRLLVSEDGGQSWTDLGENIPEPRVWSSALALTGDGTIFLGTDIGVYRSDDEGQSWTRASAGLPLKPSQNTPPSVRALRLSGDRLYAALTEGGLYFSDDRGESWQSTLAGEAAAATQPPPTPAPISTPTRQPPASPASCRSAPTYFSDLWAQRVTQLGCPVEAQRLTMVEQTFEGGRMFWRSDLAVIYALPSNGPYSRFDDTWDDSQPAYLCPDLGPSQTPPTPQHGFGKVWCDQPQIRQLLGQATSQERPFEATLQTFETGLIFQTDQDSPYILESESNNWERVEQ